MQSTGRISSHAFWLFGFSTMPAPGSGDHAPVGVQHGAGRGEDEPDDLAHRDALALGQLDLYDPLAEAHGGDLVPAEVLDLDERDARRWLAFGFSARETQKLRP